MHSIKSFTANQIRKLYGNSGHVWLDESYDRAIRHEDEYLEKSNYLINNPLKAGIVDKPEDYRWLYVDVSDPK
jgi:pyocin large subunit-like protein